MGGWWQELLVGWIVFFVIPKGVFLPVFGAMYRAMKNTDEQDRRDAVYLAERARSNGDGDDPVPARYRRRPVKPRDDGPRRETTKKLRAPS
jgi:hypothetical protein